MASVTVGQTLLSLKQGDITLEEVDVIVNAANSSLMGGGGVDGAIHRAGGPKILDECRRIRHERGDLPTGEAVITTGGNLKAKYVIHTVGPVWRGGTHDEAKLLSHAYRNSLKIAADKGLRSVAFPSISSGIYGFPIAQASKIAFETVVEFVRHQATISDVRFITFSQDDHNTYLPLFSSIITHTTVR